MKKNKSTIILILVFFVGLSVMLYPTLSDYVNQLHQSRAVATYAEDVDNLTDADYSAYFEAADAFNAQIAADPDALFHADRFTSYNATLDVTGTGIMGYITIEKIGVELPIYHGTSDGVLQVAAGHLEGTSLPVGGGSTHAVISAHRGLPSAKLFTNLDQLEVGDTFTITVLDRVLTYEVDQISIVLPTETDNLQGGGRQGLRHPDDLHPLRHQLPPPSGAGTAHRNAGQAQAHPCNSRCHQDRTDHHSSHHGTAPAAGAAALAAVLQPQTQIYKR